MNRTTAYATTTGLALPKQPAAGAREACAPLPSPVVRDLRDRAGRSPHALLFGPHDLVVITGLPGSGKSTLMRRAVRGRRIDSQDTRDRWDRGTPSWLPYAIYRPLVRLAHYAGLRRALRTGEGVVVHDCGTQAWVRAWLAREARRRGGTLHLLLLDVTPEQALAGQRARGRGVSRYAFLRHRHAAARLVHRAERGDLPRGCGAAILLDRAAANTLRRIGFTG
ncbi:ATP-binding protein [Streptomyces spinoverrucosus]|uniref:ATP-binding protein n=1 Tax=Streptomyces spinoverrucosus TaxID=284043 RepID=A0A4Y3VSA5_9ACTN|nr:AAA family ATPase [Streptomyces spinoverrucosus]GEC09108.1 ATP-binding protein [Streptomyces spinoverrucosus]GHB85369.1 ATP-binding protein [Streptomyces spinoverrucosus]